MLRLSIEEMIQRIGKGIAFEAEARDRSFRIKIREYVPYVCTAIHDGGNFRDELKLKTVLSDYERWYEEDPHTADFMSSMPIVLAGQDSRFEYDLNRDPNNCVYDTAWGKRVWKRPLTKPEKQRSLAKHTAYYKVTEALIAKIESLFGGCVVYDIHSYNYKRWDRPVPVFNIGTERIDNERYGDLAEAWRQELDAIEVADIDIQAKINDTFWGRGYNLQFITERFDHTLVLATEISKIYCDELTGEDYPAIITEVQEQMKTAVLNHANRFAEEMTNWKHREVSRLLPKDLEKSILKVDRELFQLVKHFELLNYINPINLEQEKKAFFASKCTTNPEFRYRPININPFELKRKLYKLEVEHISDVNIAQMYADTIGAYVDKIDLLASLGTNQFLYNSLRYFGEPDKQDVRNAEYLLHLPELESETQKVASITAEDAVPLFKQAFDDYGMEAKVELSSKTVAAAMVLNRKKKVLLKRGARFGPKQLQLLINHEIGVHMVTTMNSGQQPLKIFNLGLPVNTCTQEGLAVLSEYLSGTISMKRLRELGLRVIALDMVTSGADFRKTFRVLVNDHGMDVNEAFFLVTRAYRGGGFTKDFLYLRGFRDLYHFWKAGNDLRPLLIGKTSLDYYPTIVEMMDRGLLRQPQFITRAFEQPNLAANDPAFPYILSGIQ